MVVYPLAFGRLRQEDPYKFKASLGYIIRLCFKKKKKEVIIKTLRPHFLGNEKKRK